MFIDGLNSVAIMLFGSITKVMFTCLICVYTHTYNIIVNQLATFHHCILLLGLLS